MPRCLSNVSVLVYFQRKLFSYRLPEFCDFGKCFRGFNFVIGGLYFNGCFITRFNQFTHRIINIWMYRNFVLYRLFIIDIKESVIVLFNLPRHIINTLLSR